MHNIIIPILTGLFAGLLAAFLGVVPFSAVWFAVCVPWWIISALLVTVLERK